MYKEDKMKYDHTLTFDANHELNYKPTVYDEIRDEWARHGWDMDIDDFNEQVRYLDFTNETDKITFNENKKRSF